MVKKSAKGKGKTRIRYGIIGAGWISQVFMASLARTNNSEVTAIVTGDAKKAKALSKRYRAEHAYDYDGYGELLRSGNVDAVYIGLPNWMHAEYAIAALEAGIHVLLEKPMAVSVEECEAIRAAAQKGKAKLIVAYRLHCEPATLEAIELVRKGEIGEPRFFSSVMGQMVEKANHRAKNGYWAGPVADMGPYPLNAARQLFGSEPLEVAAVGVKQAGFDFHDTVAVTLRFPGDRLAQFTVSYTSVAADSYTIIGTKGELSRDPGFTWGKPVEQTLKKNGKARPKQYKPTDHFGGEAQYFSDCILTNKMPEPDGEEGLADIRVIAAIEKALESGRPQPLEPFHRKRKPQMSQAVRIPYVKDPRMVDAATPAG